MAILQLRDVSKSFGQGARRVDAVREVTLDVDRGEVVALEGPSGSGKTTLLALAGALLTPTSGEIRVDGDDITRYGARARTRAPGAGPRRTGPGARAPPAPRGRNR